MHAPSIIGPQALESRPNRLPLPPHAPHAGGKTRPWEVQTLLAELGVTNLVDTPV